MALEEIRNDSYYIGTFDCQQRYVRFDLNAFAEMEKIYGSMEAANEALSKGTMQDIRKILWLGLIHDQAVLDEVTGEPIKYNLTVYQVGKWLTPSNMKEVMQKLMDAINGSMPEDADGAPDTDNKVINMNAANAAGADENLTQPPQDGTGHSTTTPVQ
ncbi:MAG TPA: hypothetical protein DIW26_06350 [Ruminococcus sp.]|nr:hypothetical protein [Ruminococcus sp.]